MHLDRSACNYENWLCLAEDTKWRHHLARRFACLETAGLSLLPLCSTDISSSVQVYLASPGNLMRSNNARYNLALIMSHWILALMLLISQTKETIARTWARSMWSALQSTRSLRPIGLWLDLKQCNGFAIS